MLKMYHVHQSLVNPFPNSSGAMALKPIPPKMAHRVIVAKMPSMILLQDCAAVVPVTSKRGTNSIGCLFVSNAAGPVPQSVFTDVNVARIWISMRHMEHAHVAMA